MGGFGRFFRGLPVALPFLLMEFARCLALLPVGLERPALAAVRLLLDFGAADQRNI
jgi:hypothetical protein